MKDPKAIYELVERQILSTDMLCTCEGTDSNSCAVRITTGRGESFRQLAFRIRDVDKDVLQFAIIYPVKENGTKVCANSEDGIRSTVEEIVRKCFPNEKGTE